MSGFCKITFVGEYYGQKVINIVRYRSTEWLPFQGNPFEDMLNIVDAVNVEVGVHLIDCLPSNYTLLRVEGVGYDDTYTPVTPSPVVRDDGTPGSLGALETSGALIAAALHLQVGPQVQINGIGTSKRNRGYLAIGPVGETYCDNYGHFTTAYRTILDTFAQHVDNPITMLVPAIVLTPIRIHEKSLLGINIFRTYSDVLGYAVPRRIGTRKSRLPEA